MSVNSRVKATKIIGQRKAFYTQRIPEPIWAAWVLFEFYLQQKQRILV